MTDERDWIRDHGELVAFAHVLHDLCVFENEKAVIDFFEKPWKWTPEHQRWVTLGKPLDLLEIEQLQEEPEPRDLEDRLDAALADTERPSLSESGPGPGSNSHG